MKRLLLLSFGIILSASAISNRVYIGNSLDSILQVGDPQYLISEDKTLSLGEVQGLPFDDSPTEVLRLLNLKNDSREFWIRIPITKSSPSEIPVFFSTFTLGSVSLFQVLGSKIDTSEIGLKDIKKIYTHPSDPRVVELLPFDSSEELFLYIKVRHSHGIGVPRRFWFEFREAEEFQADYEEQIESKTLDNYFYTFFCGLLIFQLLYVLLQWYLVRKREYANYAAYILCVFFYFYARYSVFNASIESLAWVGAGAALLINSPLLVLPSFFYFRFTRFFVDLKTRDPKLNKYFKWFEVFLMVCVLAILVLQNVPNDFNKSVALWAALITQIPFAVYALIRIGRQRRIVAYFLVAASSFALISHLLANFLPYFYPNMYQFILPLQITMIGILIEVGLFNTGLLFKARESETQKLESQKLLLAESSEKRKIQDEYSQIRDKIASDLHDDLGSSLSSIQIYGFAARRKLAEEDKAQTLKLLSNIERTSESMLNNMSDMIWAINPQNDTNDKLIERIQAFAYDILAACNCQFNIEVDDDFYSLKLNQAQRRNVLLIVKEAVNNAAKYSQATAVKLIITNKSNNYLISIIDNGLGIGVETREGNGMRTMRKRAEELSDFFELRSDEKGTMISFKL